MKQPTPDEVRNWKKACDNIPRTAGGQLSMPFIASQDFYRLVESWLEMHAKLHPTGKCAYEGCEQPATMTACGRNNIAGGPDSGHPKPASYCATHANAVVGEGMPEYTPECPNCDCRFGVN